MFDVKKLDGVVGYALGIKANLWMKEISDAALKDSSEKFYSIMDKMKDYVCIDLCESELEVIIRKEELEKETLTIKDATYNIGFIIGRKGRNIANIKNNILQKYPDSKIKRIHVMDPLLPIDTLNIMNRDFVNYIADVVKEYTVLENTKEVESDRFIQIDDMNYEDTINKLKLQIHTISIVSNMYKATVIVMGRVIENIVRDKVVDVLALASDIYMEASKHIYLDDNRFTGNTLVMAKMEPQTNSSRLDNIMAGSDGSRWLVGYICSEDDSYLYILTKNAHVGCCYKDCVIIIDSIAGCAHEIKQNN